MTPAVTLRRPSRSRSEVHLWRADLNRDRWPAKEDLPAVERERAQRILDPARGDRWAASRWALRQVLASYLEESPSEIELRIAAAGKPALAAPGALRFNLSHSAGVALVAVAFDRDVGVDLQRVGARPRAFYDAWARREAVAKCLGVGLGVPLPDGPVAVSELDLGEEWAAAVALAGEDPLPVRRFRLRPAATAAPGRR